MIIIRVIFVVFFLVLFAPAAISVWRGEHRGDEYPELYTKQPDLFDHEYDQDLTT